jgi:hypothetical protein
MLVAHNKGLGPFDKVLWLNDVVFTVSISVIDFFKCSPDINWVDRRRHDAPCYKRGSLCSCLLARFR